MHCSHAYSTLDMMDALVDGFCNMWQKNTICTVMKSNHPPYTQNPTKRPNKLTKGMVFRYTTVVNPRSSTLISSDCKLKSIHTLREQKHWN